MSDNPIKLAVRLVDQPTGETYVEPYDIETGREIWALTATALDAALNQATKLTLTCYVCMADGSVSTQTRDEPCAETNKRNATL